MKRNSLVGTLVLLLKASEQQETGWALARNTEEASSDTFDQFGDCIGLGPGMGKPGGYVQSDLQFVQKVQEELRMFLVNESEKSENNTLAKIIPDAFNINLQTRFFVNDQHTA